MALKKLNKRTGNSMYKIAEQNQVPEHVEKARELLCNGFSKDEVVSWFINNKNLSPYQAKTITSSVLDAVVSTSGDEAFELYRTIKMSLMGLLKTSSEMYNSAESDYDRADALKIKLKVLAQMRDLLPRQVQLENLNEETDNTRKLLFDIHGIDPDKVLEGEE